MGFADMLLYLGIPYDSNEGVDLAEHLMGFINRCGHNASRELAAIRGSFPLFGESIYKDEAPLRNGTVTTIAPTGTISMIGGCSSGVEPIFAYAYIRSGRLRYPVLMHSIVNLMGSVIAPMIMSMLDLEALSNIDPNATNEEVLALYGSMLPGLLLYMAYLFVTFALSVTGLVFLILNCRKLVWKDSACQLPAGNRVKTAYLNSGMLVFLIATLALTILSVLL
jgi:hypothetical protein